MSLSFHEKSIWCSLGATVLVSATYFPETLRAAMENPSTDFSDFTSLATRTIVLLIAIQIVSHTLISLNAGKSPDAVDERDVLVRLKASNISHWFLAIGVLTLIGHIFFVDQFQPDGKPNLLQPFGMANLLLLLFVATEAVGYMSQLIYYRKGV